MRIGVGVSSRGDDALRFAERARQAEEMGFDTVLLSDHIVNPVTVQSRYPYSRDGQFGSGADAPWVDVLVSMAYLAATTTTIELASGVLILPLREPLALAKQLASIDVLSSGRVVLGVGAGWMREEFEALGVAFSDRGPRTDDYIALLRCAWGGEIESFTGRTYRVDTPIRLAPRPAHDIPILIGGISDAALRRAGSIGDGWYGLFPDPPGVGEVAERIAVMRKAAESAGRDPLKLRVMISLGRIEDLSSLVTAAAELAGIGVNQIVVRNNLMDYDAMPQLVEQIHSL